MRPFQEQRKATHIFRYICLASSCITFISHNVYMEQILIGIIESYKKETQIDTIIVGEGLFEDISENLVNGNQLKGFGIRLIVNKLLPKYGYKIIDNEVMEFVKPTAIRNTL